MDADIRREAVKLRSATYKSTKPCIRGHGSDRYTKTGRCVQCAKDAVAQWRKDIGCKVTVRAPRGVSRSDAIATLRALGFVEV